jgi:hypothetical protein
VCVYTYLYICVACIFVYERELIYYKNVHIGYKIIFVPLIRHKTKYDTVLTSRNFFTSPPPLPQTRFLLSMSICYYCYFLKTVNFSFAKDRHLGNAQNFPHQCCHFHYHPHTRCHFYHLSLHV